jgi:hypothetical protein
MEMENKVSIIFEAKTNKGNTMAPFFENKNYCCY